MTIGASGLSAERVYDSLDDARRSPLIGSYWSMGGRRGNPFVTSLLGTHEQPGEDFRLQPANGAGTKLQAPGEVLAGFHRIDARSAQPRDLPNLWKAKYRISLPLHCLGHGVSILHFGIGSVTMPQPWPFPEIAYLYEFRRIVPRHSGISLHDWLDRLSTQNVK